MKRILLLLCGLCLVAGCGPKTVASNPPAPPSPTKDWTITATWTYNSTDSPLCTSSVTTGCVTGFTWGYLSGSGAVVSLKTSPASVCTGSTEPLPCTDNTTSVLPIGTSGFQIVTNYLTNAGVASTTSPVPFTLGTPVTAANATGFSVSLL